MQTAATPLDQLDRDHDRGTPNFAPAFDHRHAITIPVVALATAALAACGGGSDASTASATTPLATATPVSASSQASSASPLATSATPATAKAPATATATLSRVQAARILAQAAFGGSAVDIQNVMSLGLSGWLKQQFALAPSQSNVAWIQAQGLDLNGKDVAAVQSSFWRKLISSPDVLRQRIMLALTDLFDVSALPLLLASRGMATAFFLDQVEAHAFGNYSDLLLAVSHTPAMGSYLTFLHNVKANPATGTMPDENYARELMQLFAIGTVDLNMDGTPIMNASGNGVAAASYGQNDVLNMARVLTGWQLDSRTGDGSYASLIRPMKNVPAACDTGSKVVLGTTIPANLDGEQNLDQAIAILMAHPNMPPFVSRQLIQRLVTSNPSAGYVARVATVFASTNGDMKSIITAILTDTEATSNTNLNNPQAGKLREPVVRYVQWARTFGLSFAANQWADIGNLSNQGHGLAESPLESPNVFFFFQPGYVPPNTDLTAGNITAPEFAITNECSVAGYMNFMQVAIGWGIGDSNGVPVVAPNYSALLPLVNVSNNSAALLAELNVLLAAGQISAATLSALQSALDSINAGTTGGQTNRLHAALMLVMSSPEYLVQK